MLLRDVGGGWLVTRWTSWPGGVDWNVALFVWFHVTAQVFVPWFHRPRIQRPQNLYSWLSIRGLQRASEPVQTPSLGRGAGQTLFCRFLCVHACMCVCVCVCVCVCMEAYRLSDKKYQAACSYLPPQKGIKESIYMDRHHNEHFIVRHSNLDGTTGFIPEHNHLPIIKGSWYLSMLGTGPTLPTKYMIPVGPEPIEWWGGHGECTTDLLWDAPVSKYHDAAAKKCYLSCHHAAQTWHIHLQAYLCNLVLSLMNVCAWLPVFHTKKETNKIIVLTWWSA